MSPADPANVAVARAAGHPSAVAAQAKRSPRYTSSCPLEAATSMLQVPALACSHAICALMHEHRELLLDSVRDGAACVVPYAAAEIKISLQPATTGGRQLQD